MRGSGSTSKYFLCHLFVCGEEESVDYRGKMKLLVKGTLRVSLRKWVNIKFEAMICF